MNQNCYVILHIRPGPPYPDPAKSPHIAADARFKLSSEIWIERLNTKVAKCIQRACEPANHNIYNDVWDRHLYAFVRKVPNRESSLYQGLQELYTIIALSRIIHPTTTGDRYCAKILPHHEDDPPIQCIQTRGGCQDVIIGSMSQDWLSPDDGVELQKLLPWALTTKPMHRRIHRAFWNHEQAMRTYYLDLRWNLVVSGLEALITVEDRRVRQQFIRRVGELATDFGMPLSDAELDKAYKLRSELAHAQGFLFDFDAVLPRNEHSTLYDKLESLLRAAVKRSLLDEAFGQNFANKASVQNRWP